MPEGHTVHRIARQLTLDMVGHRVAVSSPQGRFADGAALLDGRVMTSAAAYGKHLLVRFDEPVDDGARDDGAHDGRAPGPVDDGTERWLRVHLGLYGAWDFQGVVSPLADGDAVASLGAPRRRAVRMGEGEHAIADAADFPPPPVGQVRVRLLTERTVADLRGPTACAVVTSDEVRRVLDAAGPDPHVHPDGEAEFVRRVRRRRVAVGQLLMDQGVVSGIGNVYRAELLFRAHLDPYTLGERVPEETLRDLWRDWSALLADGIRTGVMQTRADLDDDGRREALADPTVRHAVYRRAGERCYRCGATVASAEMAGRNLYWCPGCQT